MGTISKNTNALAFPFICTYRNVYTGLERIGAMHVLTNGKIYSVESDVNYNEIRFSIQYPVN